MRLSGSMNVTMVLAPVTFISFTRRMAIAHRWCTTISRFFWLSTLRGGVGMVMVRASLSKLMMRSIFPSSFGWIWVCCCGMSPQMVAPFSPRMMVGDDAVPLSSGLMNRGSVKRWMPPLMIIVIPPLQRGSPVRRHSRACRSASCRLSLGVTMMSPALRVVLVSIANIIRSCLMVVKVQ